MTDDTIERIRKEAHNAAEQNLKPSQACSHPFGSVAGRIWMIEYCKAINRLNTHERRAARAAPDEAAP